MKYICLTFIAALTIASSSAIGYESCWEYKNKNDTTGYNACESRNMSDIRNQREREEQKRRETDDRWRREAAESDEKKFREKQLDLQMQQLEIQKRNSSKPTCDDATALKVVHDLVIKAQEPVNKLFKKYISSGDCMAAMELAEAVLFSSMLEVLSNAKATGRQFDAEELIQSVLTGSLLEFTKKCGNHQEKQKKK